MKSARKSTVSANVKENILYVTLRGVVPKRDAEALYTEIRFCVADLQPGFGVITDLSDCQIGHLSAIDTSKKIMHFLIDKQVGKVVRILGPSRVIYLQLAKLADKAMGYHPLYVHSKKEAQELLRQSEEQMQAGS